MTARPVVAVAAVALAAAAANAQLHTGDIAITVDSGQVVIGAAEATGPVFPRCVFDAVLNGSGQTPDPGYDSANGTFNSSMTGGLNIRSALRKWENGNFDTIPDHNTTKMAVGWGPFFELSPPTDQIVSTNFGLGANPNGKYHHHMIYTVVGDLSPAVYMLELEFWANTPLLVTSEPFWMVYNLNADANDFADAVQFVEDNIAWCTAPVCIADLTTTGAGIGDPGYGVPDGQVTSGDIQYFVNAWSVGDTSIADVTTTGAGEGDPGFGVPDGQITSGDIQFYVNEWVAGCP